MFADMTGAAGLNFNRVNGAFGKRWLPETMGGGGAVIDYDNDGYPDILFVNGDWYAGHPLPGHRPTLSLYHNDRNGKFTEVTTSTGLNVSIQGMGVAIGDYDNDGFDDILITGVSDCRLFHNDGGKRFVDVTKSSGIRDAGWSTSAAWLDYDNDGKLDLFVCNYVRWSPATDVFCGVNVKTYCEPTVYSGDSCRLFHNEGSGRFKDVTKQAGIMTDQCKALGVCILDVNNDNRPDILVTNDLMPNTLYRNNGDGTFKNVALEFGLAVSEMGSSRAGMGVDSAACGTGGGQFVAIGNFTTEGLALYDLSTPPPYSDSGKQSGIGMPSFPFVTFGVLFADFDNDGNPDLFATNGHIEDTIEVTHRGQTYAQPSLVFWNQANGHFSDVSVSAGPGITTPLVGRGACRGDFDNDGKVDVLLIPNSGPCKLLRNVSPNNHHWLTITLEGVASNRDGYGATVSIEGRNRKQTVLARSGSSYLSASDRRIHFGLGDDNAPIRIVIKWSSGRTEHWDNTAVDQALRLREGSGQL